MPSASRTTSTEDSWLTKSILDLGESFWIRRAASMPFNDRKPDVEHD